MAEDWWQMGGVTTALLQAEASLTRVLQVVLPAVVDGITVEVVVVLVGGGLHAVYPRPVVPAWLVEPVLVPLDAWTPGSAEANVLGGPDTPALTLLARLYGGLY